MSAEHPEHSAHRLGPYRLLRRIGVGGMAEVFLAERVGEAGFARSVAIKTILTFGAEDEAVQLFLDEARVASLLVHPNIVQTLDLGLEAQTLFIVMEYIPGPSLARLVRDLHAQSRFMSPAAVAFVGAKVAAALDYAWARATTPEGVPLRMVHRDVSPQNILITRQGVVKLTDFGIARASVQTHRTRTGQVRGKASYMAPEQVRGKTLDGRTDPFALCLVLYEALTAKRAYQRKTDLESMRAVLQDPVEPIRRSNPGVPEALAQTIMKGLAKAPDDRWASAGELQRALEALYADRAEAELESEVGGIVVALFGSGETSTDPAGAPFEGWQPAVAAASSLIPQRLATDSLSAELQDLLQPPARPRPARAPAPPTPQRAGPTAPAGVPSTSAERPKLKLEERKPPTTPADVRRATATVLRTLGGPSHPPPAAVPSAAARRRPSPLMWPVVVASTVGASLVVVAAFFWATRASRPAPVTPRPQAVPRTSEDPVGLPTAAPPPAPAGAAAARAPRPRRSFRRRVFAARQRYSNRGDAEMSARLSRLLVDLSIRPPTADDRRLLERAEAGLR